MNDIPTPVLVGVGVVVVLVLLLMSRDNSGGASSPIATVGTDPGAVSLAEAQTAASAQAFGDLASVIHDVNIAQISAQVQNHATDVQGTTAEYVAGQQASAAQAIAAIQAEMERERLGMQTTLGQAQVNAETHATNVGFWSGLLGQYGGAILQWAFGNHSAPSSFGTPSFSGGFGGPSFGGYNGGVYG